MSEFAIRLRNLGKRYTPPRHRSLFSEGLFRRKGTPTENCRWVLQGITFDMLPGEVVGIVGPNGGGKSTLLKILARVTRPTVGYGEIAGRVGSLLEIGTGFHPFLTGRENVFLNGSILGMSRREISSKMEEIVDFSGVAQQIDMPVRFYSSGQYMRLGFSVAAHLNASVLLVDEVLAVGDVAFRRKCMDKMRSLANAGRTILFVSHQKDHVQDLCNRAIWLSGGCIVESGDPRSILQAYEDSAVS